MLLVSLFTAAGIGYFMLKHRKETARMESAQRFFAARDYKQARPLLIAIVRKDAANEQAYRMLATIAEERYELSDAVHCYSRATALAPLDRELRLRYAAILSLQGAAETLVPVLRADFRRGDLPLNARAIYLEAAILTRNEDVPEESLVAIREESPSVGNYLDGVRAVRAGKGKESLEFFDKVVLKDLPLYLQCKTLNYRGVICYELGDYKGAEEAYLACAELVPALGAFRLGDFYVSRGRIADSVKWFETSTQLHPNEFLGFVALGEAYAGLNRKEDLAALIARYSPRTRHDIEVVNYLNAAACFLEGKFPEMNTYLDACPRWAPRTFYRLMRLYGTVAAMDTDKLAPAVLELKKSLNTEEAQTRIVELLRPLLFEYYRKNDQVNAQKVAAAVLSVTQKPSPTRSVALHVMLVGASQQRNYTEMISLATTILSDDSSSALANLAMGEALLGGGNPEESLMFFAKLPPDYTGAHLGRAIAYDQLKRTNDALKEFRLAWAQAPGDRVLFQSYADLLLRAKQYDELRGLFPALGDTPEAAFSRHFMSGKIAENSGRRAVAEKEYMASVEVLKTLPQTLETRYRSAYLLAVCGRDADAAALYRDLLKERPDWVLLLVNLSEVEEALGNKDEALRLAERAAKIAPDLAAVQECLARRRAETNPPAPGNEQ